MADSPELSKSLPRRARGSPKLRLPIFGRDHEIHSIHRYHYARFFGDLTRPPLAALSEILMGLRAWPIGRNWQQFACELSWLAPTTKKHERLWQRLLGDHQNL